MMDNQKNEGTKADLEQSRPLFYVGIGASAGGLEALDSFFSHMPPSSGLAFVIVQHLSPDYKSMMVELLAKRTSMTVLRAEEGMLVEPDTLYLIPPRKQLAIFQGKLFLKEIDPRRSVNLPIDVFLRSLADDQAEKAVAVILSGTGSDGVRGLRAVKEAGGMIMVQSEESSKFDGMPRAAISTGLADVVLPPHEMPSRLLSFSRRPMVRNSEARQLFTNEDILARLFALLREQTKVDFSLYKESTISRRIERRMTVNQVNELDQYVRMLEERPGEVTTLYRELLIGVTSFFRDKEVFEELCNTFLPELLRGTADREIRFWVAGCSTGEEAYTLAILARECMDRIKQPINIKIFATDIDKDALLFAGNGLYPESIAADLPPGFLTKYFLHKGEHYQVQRFVREMVVFAQHNLVKDPPFTNIDLVSCRNLLIYLQPVLQQKVMTSFNFSLKQKGILLLGESETPGEMEEYFEIMHHRYKIFRSLGKKRLPVEGPRLQQAGTNMSSTRQGYGAIYRGAQPLGVQEEERLQERLLQSLSGEYIPLTAVVNERMELLHLVGHSEGILYIPPGKIINDITRMVVKELAIPLATGLQKVFQDSQEIKYNNIRLPQQEGSRLLHLNIKRLPGKQGQEALAAVFFQEMPHQTYNQESVNEGALEYDVSKEAEQRINDLEQELQFTKENLQATIEELETSNEELQATNEELLASNEELQSTNEELQSVNEELHTVNAEYQSKIMELTEITNDLDNLIAATHIGTLFLDENLDIRKYTSEVGDIFHIQESDVGRPVAHLRHKLEGVEPFYLIEEVVQIGESRQKEVRTLDGRWFLMRVMPYNIGGSSMTSGAVLTFTDIGPIKRSEEKLQMRHAQLLSMFNSIDHIIYVIDFNTYQILYANTTAQEAFGKDLVGGICYQELQGFSEPCHFCTNPVIKQMHYKPYRWEHYNPVNRRYYQIVDQMIRWPDGRDVRFELAIDITERKQIEEDLQRETDILNTTQRLTGVGGWEWNVDKQEMYWTDQVYRIHGFDPESFQPGSGEHIEKSLECYDQEDRKAVRDAFKKACETGEPYDLECDFTDLEGRRKRIRTRAEVVMQDGRVEKVIGNIMVISS